MASAPMPANENARLKVLRSLDILDTPQEDFSQALAVAAASIANTPIAAITLVDAERQWFKGSHGLAVRQTPRAIAFCAHTILNATPLIVENALADPRFHTNPLVIDDPHIRFYAGLPLLVSGHRVGALCVIDNRQRTLSDCQLARLQSLARGTSAWLEGFRLEA